MTQVADNTTQTPAQRDRPDGKVSVRVSADRMSAALVVVPAGKGGQIPTVGDALDALKAAGVVYGIDKKAIAQALKEAKAQKGLPGALEPVVVAVGKPAENGRDGTLEYHPSLTAASGRPKERADGGVDLFDLNLVHNVAKGTVLAKRTKPTDGKPGITVLGEEAKARPGKEAAIRPGKGSAFSSDELSIVATNDGHAILLEGRVVVAQVFEVRSDVGPETGNIDFVGTVTVRGNLLPGYKIKAAGDVEIYGGVDGGTIEAEGNVTVMYGIQGGGHGRIVAGGSVKAKFIENCEVQAGSSVWASDGILTSQVDAGESIEVLGKRGSIIGGRVSARDRVAARFLGSPMGGATEIAVGVAPRVVNELLAARKELTDGQDRLRRTDQAVAVLSDHAKHGTLPADKVEMLRQLVTVHDQLSVHLRELEARARDLQRQLSEIRTAHIDAQDICYPGVRVSVGNAHFQVNDEVQHTRMRMNAMREVELGPL